MKTKKIIIIFILPAILACLCSAKQAVRNRETKSVTESILERLNEEAANLKSYQAEIQWVHTQPLFETVTLRKGEIYYVSDPNNSKLRINFKTLKQDDGKEQRRREDFLFDGVWLTRLDYQNKTISYDQFAPITAPIKPFEIVVEHFPLLGFSGTEKLKKQFNIKYIRPEKNTRDRSIHLRLIPKPGSRCEKDYKQFDFWIGRKSNLPIKIISQTSETDIFEISFSDIKVNKKFKSSVFNLEKPADFSENRTALK